MVAPAAGSGLESTDLITDGSGNLISNYIYGGGSSPFMRLDASGNAVYYLTDAMGTVIGLADGMGAEVGDFRYDSFGNLRSSQGAGADVGAAGGDFRFQGQWLESSSGLYYFRARDYDPGTGLFLSRDVVDIVEMEPESFNPYQFVYGNPHVYSDPTGMFTMAELNAADTLRNILSYGRTYLADAARDFIKDTVGELFGNILIGTINSLLPGAAEGDVLTELAEIDADPAGRRFENFLTQQICGLLQSSSFSERAWTTPEVATSGVPKSNGLNCSEYINPVALATRSARYPNPDFLFKQGRPTDYSIHNPDAYLIGDIKFSTAKAVNEITGDKTQWQAMYRYARRFQAMPFVLYVSFRFGGSGQPSQRASRVQMAQREAFKRNVILFLLNISD